MKEKKRKFRLRLVNNGEVTHRVKPSVIQLREIPVDVEDLDCQLLTVAPDWTAAMDTRAPTELKLRVVAAVKSHSMGRKSIDLLYKRYRATWECRLQSGPIQK